MCKRIHSKVFRNLDKEKVWSLMTDIEAWPTWHDDLEFCKLVGGFQVGSYFYLKPKGMKSVKIELIEIKEGFSFTDCTRFHLAKMYDTHVIEETSEGLKLTNHLEITGPLKYLWFFLVGRHVAASAPKELKSLARLSKEER